MQAGGGHPLSFGKSRARLRADTSVKVTFDDMAGIDEVKEDLGEIIDFLKKPTKYTRLGGRIPKGVLLLGPPGTDAVNKITIIPRGRSIGTTWFLPEENEFKHKAQLENQLSETAAIVPGQF